MKLWSREQWREEEGQRGEAAYEDIRVEPTAESNRSFRLQEEDINVLCMVPRASPRVRARAGPGLVGRTNIHVWLHNNFDMQIFFEFFLRQTREGYKASDLVRPGVVWQGCPHQMVS